MRTANVTRNTLETQITVILNLDGTGLSKLKLTSAADQYPWIRAYRSRWNAWFPNAASAARARFR